MNTHKTIFLFQIYIYLKSFEKEVMENTKRKCCSRKKKSKRYLEKSYRNQGGKEFQFNGGGHQCSKFQR